MLGGTRRQDGVCLSHTLRLTQRPHGLVRIGLVCIPEAILIYSYRHTTVVSICANGTELQAVCLI